MENSIKKKYTLSGDGTVVVYKPFGDNVYATVVEMDGVYPESGKTEIGS